MQTVRRITYKMGTISKVVAITVVAVVVPGLPLLMPIIRGKRGRG